MFSRTTEYALRAMVWIAHHPDKLLKTEDIAQGIQAPSSYLSKILQALSQSKLIQAKRGLNGGFFLEKDPKEISLFTIVYSVDPESLVLKCPLKLHKEGLLCPLYKKLESVIEQIDSTLKNTTLQELLEVEEDSSPLCTCDVLGENKN